MLAEWLGASDHGEVVAYLEYVVPKLQLEAASMLGGQEELAGEVVAEALVDVLRNGVPVDTNIEEELRKLVRHSVRKWFRRGAREVVTDSVPEVEDSAVRPDENLERKQALEAVERAMAGLRERERDVLERYLRGETLFEIGQAIGATPSRVSQIIRRIRLRLRAEVERATNR